MDYSVNRKLLRNEEGSDSEGETSTSPRIIPPDGDPCCNHSTGSEPRDWYRGGYVTFYLLGIITMLPYTFFVTANDYWMYKLRDVSLNGSELTNKTALQAEFTSYLTIAASGPSVFFMIINSLFSHRISIQLRMFGSLIIIFFSFILTTAFVEVDTDSWQDAFFGITLATVVLVNVLGAILTAGLFGIASRFSSRYITAVVSGQALGGMFPALVYIGALAVGVSSMHCALLYFCIANVTILISLASYYVLSQSLFFQFHMLAKAPARSLNYDPTDGDDTGSSPRVKISITSVFSKTWMYGVAAMLCYSVTVSVYPGVMVLIGSVNQPSLWTDKYFVPVIAFLIFSIWDYLGRVTAGFFKWPIKRPWVIVGITLMRLSFIPFFLLCNAHPRHNLPVLIYSDSAYVAVTCLLGFTNGYLTNILLINVPKIVEVNEQEAGSSIIATFISLGCSIGAFFSFVFIRNM